MESRYVEISLVGHEQAVTTDLPRQFFLWRKQNRAVRGWGTMRLEALPEANPREPEVMKSVMVLEIKAWFLSVGTRSKDK